MYVRLNLATTPLVSHRRFFVGATLLAVVASVLCVFLGWRLYDVRKAEADYRAKSDKLQSEMSRVMAQREELEQFFAREENSNLRERAKLVDAVIEANSFNWTKMFMDLEHTLPPGVHVFRIEPRLEKGTVTVKFVAGASSQEAQVELLKAFEESRSFSHFELHSVTVPQQPGADALTLEFSVIYTGS